MRFHFFFNQEIFYETIGNNDLGSCTDSQLMFFFISDITILCNIASSFAGLKLDEPLSSTSSD